MKKIYTIIATGGIALSLAACGNTAQQACVDGFGSNARAVGNGGDERFCVVNGQPVGEVEKQSFGGWEADD